MPDVVSQQKRSEMMSGIKGKNTRPELLIRKALHAKGFRFRLHSSDVPGKPDLILPKYKAAIFVHGCFWHCHDCHLFKWPKSRCGFWKEKIEGNKTRDLKNQELLRESGWRRLVIWECAVKGKSRLDFNYLIDATSSWIISGESEFEIAGKQL